jgi:hypothetical protein
LHGGAYRASDREAIGRLDSNDDHFLGNIQLQLSSQLERLKKADVVGRVPGDGLHIFFAKQVHGSPRARAGLDGIDNYQPGHSDYFIQEIEAGRGSEHNFRLGR